jgi:NitT/TauT family transport system permease protein
MRHGPRGGREYLGEARGLGYIITQAEGVFDTTSVFAGLVVLSLFVLIIDMIVSLVESRLLKWKPSATN